MVCFSCIWASCVSFLMISVNCFFLPIDNWRVGIPLVDKCPLICLLIQCKWFYQSIDGVQFVDRCCVFRLGLSTDGEWIVDQFSSIAIDSLHFAYLLDFSHPFNWLTHPFNNFSIDSSSLSGENITMGIVGLVYDHGC